MKPIFTFLFFIIFSSAGAQSILSPNDDWTVQEVQGWVEKYGQSSTWKGLLLYQGSDSLNHHFVSRVNDDWIWFTIRRSALTLQDMKVYNKSSSAPFGYYYVDPVKDFVKIKDYK